MINEEGGGGGGGVVVCLLPAEGVLPGAAQTCQ